MRYLAILLALLVTPLAQALQPSPRGIVFDYECKHIDPAKTGFTCLHDMQKGGMKIVLHKKWSEMPKAQREFSKYEFNKIAIRAFQFGAQSFIVNADFWPKNKKKVCATTKNEPYYMFGCYVVTLK